MTVLRICFVGDSLINGTLDRNYLGWPGRLCMVERAKGHDVTLYNLGIRAQTTKDVADRWLGECRLRLQAPHPGGLVFSFGVNDMAEENGVLRVSPENSISYARQIISEAARWKPTLWIGPAPIEEERQPYSPAEGISYSFRNNRIQDLSRAYAQMAADLSVPYFELYRPLSEDLRWARALSDGDGVHPSADGYGVIAEMIDQWPSWRAWFDSDHTHL